MLAAQSYFVRTLLRAPTHFCGNNEIVAAFSFEPASENFLRHTRAVGIGGVNEIATEFNKAIEHLDADFFAAFASKGHRAEANLAHLKSGLAHQTIFHS